MVSAHFLPQVLAGDSKKLSRLGNCPVVTHESFQDSGALRLLNAAPQPAFVAKVGIADGHSHGLDEIIEIEWLFQIIESPCLNETHRIGNGSKTRHDNDGHSRQTFSAKFEDLGPAAVGQAYIRNDKTG